MRSALSSTNKRRAGFTLVEILVALAIVGILMALATQAISSSLQHKRREDTRLSTQQNLRAALTLIAQDLRSAAGLHVWNQSSCGASAACSNHSRVSIVTLDGTSTRVAEPPGNSFTNSAETRVCDASDFQDGDTAILLNGSDYQLLQITQVHHRTPGCNSSPPEKLQHNATKISGLWSPAAYIFKAQIATYLLQTDPLDPSQTVLFRRTGLGTPGAQTGVVAFGISRIQVWYGVPLNPSDPSSQLVFYETLDAAASALGSAYSAYPNVSGSRYVGNEIRAIRVALTGQSAELLPNGARDTLTLSQTVDLRR